MLVHTTTRHCELEPALKGYVQERFEKFERYARDIHEVRLVVTGEKFRHIAEIALRLNQHELVSREEATEARIAIDLAADHVEEQLRRLKDRRLDRAQRAKGTDAPAPATASDDDEGED